MSIGLGIAIAGFFLGIGISSIHIEIVNNIHNKREEDNNG